MLYEEQESLERLHKVSTKNNIFVSGIPNVLTANLSKIPEAMEGGDIIDDHIEIIHHVFVNHER